MKISFSDASKITPENATGTLIFLVGEDKQFSTLLQSFDKQAGGAFSRALTTSRFAGKKGQFFSFPSPSPLKVTHVILAGMGDSAKLDALALEAIGGSLVPQLNANNVESATLVLDALTGRIQAGEAAARIAYGATLKSYRFDKYHTKKKPEEKPVFAELTIAGGKSKEAESAFAPLAFIAEGVFLTRDLVSEPANVINPETLAEACEDLNIEGLEVTVLNEEEMYDLGMNALLGVGQGSAVESKLVVLRWNGASDADAQPIAFVGKGVTFDTGGISIKPAGGMEEMKWDMGGAGTVIGLMAALAKRKAKANVVGVVGLVENMPGGNAQRPGDVVQSMSGQTIEVLNTDAEGRLVLSDALWYTQEKFKPKAIVDLATLTGAIIISLGTVQAGLFSNDDTLSEQLTACGKLTGERLWRLPLGEEYDRQINSDIADMQNIGKDREAGSITAAQFLQRFIQDGTPWAHLDIAGTAWTKKELDTCPKGATAFGVRLLNKLVEEYYEGKN